MTPPRLEVRNLRRSFDGLTVVDNVSFAIQPGQVTCLLGPSGCGKSTTLRMIAGVDRQDAGSVLVDGELICDASINTPPERRGIGLMFQDFALFPHLTVGKNVAFGLSLPAAEAEARVRDLLAKVDLLGYIDNFPHQLSGGEQQRVALARALAPRPKVMLMDEPFSGLDNRLRDGIRDETLALLKEEDTAVLLITHEPEEAMRMADEIALMRDGRIVQSGAPYNLYNAPADKAAVAFFSDVNVLTAKVQSALASTIFGDFLCPGVPDGGAVEIVTRPQHVNIDFDRGGRGPADTAEHGKAARATVERARFMGSESLIEFALEDPSALDGAPMRVTVPNVFLPKPGTVFWLTVRRDKAFLFHD